MAAALRIHFRAQRLDNPDEEPLGVFHCKSGKYKGQRCFITAKQVARFLRTTAQVVFHLKTDDEVLQRWSAHSLRVTACNLLHRQGFSDTYIQTRLRWTSNAFLGYLRNTLYNAAAHTKALHIPQNNLPTLTNVYKSIKLPNGEVVLTNSTAGLPLPRQRAQEDIERVIHASAA